MGVVQTTYLVYIPSTGISSTAKKSGNDNCRNSIPGASWKTATIILSNELLMVWKRLSWLKLLYILKYSLQKCLSMPCELTISISGNMDWSDYKWNATTSNENADVCANEYFPCIGYFGIKNQGKWCCLRTLCILLVPVPFSRKVLAVGKYSMKLGKMNVKQNFQVLTLATIQIFPSRWIKL